MNIHTKGCSLYNFDTITVSLLKKNAQTTQKYAKFLDKPRQNVYKSK